MEGKSLETVLGRLNAAGVRYLVAGGPLAFAEAASRSVRLEIAPGIPVDFVGLEDLLAMKRKAGRPRTCWT